MSGWLSCRRSSQFIFRRLWPTWICVAGLWVCGSWFDPRGRRGGQGTWYIATRGGGKVIVTRELLPSLVGSRWEEARQATPTG